MPPAEVESAPQHIVDIKQDISQKAEQLVNKEFPKNIAKLRELIKSEVYQMGDYSQIVSELPSASVLMAAAADSAVSSNGHHQPNGVQQADAKGDVPRGERPSKRSRVSEEGKEAVKTNVAARIENNPHIVKVSEELKPILRAFMDSCSLIKVWISLLVPKMEDGNNFGVSIQAEVVKDVTYYEDDTSKYYEDLIDHFASRAKLCSKLIKYPQIEDYRTAVKECDERQFVYLTKFVAPQILHSHVLLHDLISKNYEKIQRPRGASGSSMNMY